MKIVIDIPKEMYQTIKETNMVISGRRSGRRFDYILFNAVSTGIPLPQGHGRLIDADYLKDVSLLHNFHGNNKNIVPYADRRGYRLRQREVDEAIINAQTIIEADESEDKK